MQGNRIAYIEQELFHVMHNYNIYINNDLIFKITKKFQIFKNDYSLSNGYRVEGNFMMLDFVIYDNNNKQIRNIKKYISLGDKYEIEINDVNKKEIVISIIAAITNDINRNQNSSE